MLIREYDIDPVPAPRQVRSHKWNPTKGVLRYRSFKDQVRMYGVKIPEDGSHIIFIIPMPPSWSAKRKKENWGRPHKNKPDLDNLLKALLDAVFEDDKAISDYRASKAWGYEGKIIIDDRKRED